MDNSLNDRNEFTWNGIGKIFFFFFSREKRFSNRIKIENLNGILEEDGKRGGTISSIGEEDKYADENRLRLGTYFQRPHCGHVVLLHPDLFPKGGPVGADRCWCSSPFG